MNHEQILKKAIEKAVKNGWDNQLARYSRLGLIRDDFTIIFSHDFAKALIKNYQWSIDDIEEANRLNIEPFEFYLFNTVREKDPIKYLEKFL